MFAGIRWITVKKHKARMRDMMEYFKRLHQARMNEVRAENKRLREKILMLELQRRHLRGVDPR